MMGILTIWRARRVCCVVLSFGYRRYRQRMLAKMRRKPIPPSQASVDQKGGRVGKRQEMQDAIAMASTRG